MLRPPYTEYSRLYTYHLDLKDLPEIIDPDLIGTWIEDETAILFFHKPKERLVQEICEQSGATVIYEADLDYTDWEAGREIGPFTVEDVTVAPVWSKTEADILLDPSVIFGSGFHPSTHLCLEGLLKYLKTPEIKINSALDLGCGTGLLAIAAALQGVERITAIDNNRLACEVALANVERNNVQNLVQVQERDLRANPPQTQGVDLVMANLYKGLMIELFENPDFWQAKFYLLSGFIIPMEEDLLAALPMDKVRFLDRMRHEKWCFWALASR